MAGRESEYMRGFMNGIGSITAVVMEGKTLDSNNIIGYAKETIQREMEKENAPRN